MAQCLYDIEFQLETAKCELIEHRQRIICNKPPMSYDVLQISFPSSIHTLSDRHVRQTLFNRYEKLIQQTKTDLIAVYIQAKQVEIYQYQTLFNVEIEKMDQNNHKQVIHQNIPKVLQRLITKRSLNMNEQLKIICHFTINYYIRSSYGQLENSKKKGQEENIQKRIGFLSSLIVDPVVMVVHHLTNEQLELLNRGPTYVAPGQLHITSPSQTIDTMVSKQYAPIRHQLATLFDKYHIDISRSTNFQKYVFNEFKNLYSIPLPLDIYERVVYEKKLIQSIRCCLKKNNLLLRRTADQTNMFYLMNRNDFIKASNQYMENTIDNYIVLININETNVEDEEVQEQQFKKKYQLLNEKLDNLHRENKLTEPIVKKLRVNVNRIKLPYLYFLPDICTMVSI